MTCFTLNILTAFVIGANDTPVQVEVLDCGLSKPKFVIEKTNQEVLSVDSIIIEDERVLFVKVKK